MIELQADIFIPAPPETVFRALTDWPRQGEWMPGTEVHVTKGSGTREGDEILARTALRRTGAAARVGFDDPMRITVWEQARRCDVLHLGRVVRGTGSFAVEPEGSGSRFTWAEQVEAPFGAVGARLLRLGRPVADAVLKVALKRFARWVQTYAG